MRARTSTSWSRCTPRTSSEVEGDGKEWKGKQPVIQKSRDWATVNTFHGEKVRGPYFCGPTTGDIGRFAVHFTLEITRNATGERVSLDEVGLYTVKNGLITREEFFYEGDH